MCLYIISFVKQQLSILNKYPKPVNIITQHESEKHMLITASYSFVTCIFNKLFLIVNNYLFLWTK